MDGTATLKTERNFRSVQSATGVPWNGTLQENETLMHEGAEEPTWAVFEELDYAQRSEATSHYASAGC